MEGIHSLRFVSPLRQQTQVPSGALEAGPSDTVQLSGCSSPAPLLKPDLAALKAARKADLSSKLAKALLFTGLVASAAGGILGPSVVYAQQAAPRSDLDRLKAYGLSESASQKILAEPELVSQLQTLPDPVVRQFGSLNAQQKKVLGQEIQGKTRFGLIVVQHREAFVKGKAMGMDAFPHMVDRLEDHVKKGTLTPQEGQPLIRALEDMRHLSPAQRDSIATVLVFENQAIR